MKSSSIKTDTLIPKSLWIAGGVLSITVVTCMLLFILWIYLGGSQVLAAYIPASPVDSAGVPGNLQTFIGTYHLVATSWYDPVELNDLNLDLILSPDGTAKMIRHPAKGGEQENISTGVWNAENLRAIVQFQTNNGKAMNPPVRMVFEIQDDFLVAVEHPFGTQPYIFSLGNSGQNPLVKAVHKRLASLSWLNFTDPGPDGTIYSESTRQAISVFQASQGLPATGVIDQATWQALANPAPPGQRNLTVDKQSLDLSQSATPIPIIVQGDLSLPIIRQGPPADPDGTPLVYLTFDDGPDPTYTRQVLNLLSQYRAQATFFVVGRNANHYLDLVKDEIQSGNDVANHTYNHRALVGLAPEDFTSEVDTTGQVIRSATGGQEEINHAPACLRPPYDRFDDQVVRQAAQHGYQLVLWSIDSNDWRRPGVSAIVREVTSKVFPGAIVLLHDGGGDRSQTVQALAIILQNLSQQGYRFASICHPAGK